MFHYVRKEKIAESAVMGTIGRRAVRRDVPGDQGGRSRVRRSARSARRSTSRCATELSAARPAAAHRSGPGAGYAGSPSRASDVGGLSVVRHRSSPGRAGLRRSVAGCPPHRRQFPAACAPGSARPWWSTCAAATDDFLAVATPGAGKTTFALRIAAELLADGTVEAVTVVTPTEHLKTQWARGRGPGRHPARRRLPQRRPALRRATSTARSSPTPRSAWRPRCTGGAR